jgi:hypothetical protein
MKYINVIAIKNRYLNRPGSEKIRVLTKGKQYKVIEHCFLSNTGVYPFGYSMYDDIGNYHVYSKSDFMKISEARNQKLENLGI